MSAFPTRRRPAQLVRDVAPARGRRSRPSGTPGTSSTPPYREGLREGEVVRETRETEILTVPLDEHPRLRGAAALIGTPAFAAPLVS